MSHIVFLTPGFAKNEQDTTTIPALQIYFKALKKQHPQLKITIIAFQFPYIRAVFNWYDCSVIMLNGGNEICNKIQVWKNAYQILKGLHNENPISLLHSFWLGECAFIGHLFSKKNQIKHKCTLMGQDILSSNLYLKLLPINKMNLVFVSHFQQQKFMETYKIQSSVVSWGVNHEDFPLGSNKTIDIIGVGSFTALKNYELFIDVVFEINKRFPIKVVLIGNGIQEAFLQNKIKQLLLEHTISLTGLLTYQETIKNISKAKILLHTSHYESFGMIFAEALQCKTRIVSKKIGCAFVSENWHICNSKTEMIRACIEALSVPFLEKSNASFAIEKTVENYLKIYNE